MKKPNNFDKIHGTTFDTNSGKTYRLTIDTEDNSIMWAFAKPDNTKYSLAFYFDWKNNAYEIKRAESGDGKNWVDVLHKGNFTSQPMKTINSFVHWVNWRIDAFEWGYYKL